MADCWAERMVVMKVGLNDVKKVCLRALKRAD